MHAWAPYIMEHLKKNICVLYYGMEGLLVTMTPTLADTTNSKNSTHTINGWMKSFHFL